MSHHHNNQGTTGIDQQTGNGLAWATPLRNDSALGPPAAPGVSWGSEMIDPPLTPMPTAGASNPDSDTGSTARPISPRIASREGEESPSRSACAPPSLGPTAPMAGLFAVTPKLLSHPRSMGSHHEEGASPACVGERGRTGASRPVPRASTSDPVRFRTSFTSWYSSSTLTDQMS